MQVMLLVMCAAKTTVKCQEVKPEHVEGRQCADKAYYDKYSLVPFERSSNDLVFRKETRQRKNTTDSNCPYQEGNVRGFHMAPKTSHSPDILFTPHSVNHRSA